MKIISTTLLLAAAASFVMHGFVGKHLRSDWLAWGLAFLTAGLLFAGFR